jgi:hypothetical protein
MNHCTVFTYKKNLNNKVWYGYFHKKFEQNPLRSLVHEISGTLIEVHVHGLSVCRAKIVLLCSEKS